MDIANSARRLLIRIGKALPFIICFFILIGFVESLLALMRGDFLLFEGSITLNTPLTFFIASVVRYDWIVVLLTAIVSFATETCRWNKYAVVFLILQILERNYFSSVELYIEYIYAIVVINILVSGFFVFKGIKIIAND